VLRGRWRNIIVVNVHAPSEEKSDASKDRFYEKSGWKEHNVPSPEHS